MIVQDEKRKVNARWEEGRTRKRILRVVYGVCVFLLSVLIAGVVLNREEVSSTRQPGDSTLPVLSFLVSGTEVNPVCGYASELQMQTVRGSILPVGRDRTVRFLADEGLGAFENLRFEVRSGDGTSLVENTPLSKPGPRSDAGGVTG